MNAVLEGNMRCITRWDETPDAPGSGWCAVTCGSQKPKTESELYRETCELMLLLAVIARRQIRVSHTTMTDLLRPSLPLLQIRLHGSAREFFDAMCNIAEREERTSVREADYAGVGTDLLSIGMAPPSEQPTIRFVYWNAESAHIKCDVVDAWSNGLPTHDTYVASAKRYIGQALKEYRLATGDALRLQIGKRDPLWDWHGLPIDCNGVSYPKEKMAVAVHALAVGAGPVRERLVDAFMSFHVLSPSDFPGPLGFHFQWIKAELTRTPQRDENDGRIWATISGMRIERAVRIAERIVALKEALDEVCP